MRRDRKDCDYLPYKGEITGDVMQLYKIMKWHREKAVFLCSVSCNVRIANHSMKLERIRIGGDRKEKDT